MRREPPKIYLCFHPHVVGVEALRDRSVDLEITVLKETCVEVFKQLLFCDHYVDVAAPNHPRLANRAVSLEAYVRYAHVSASRRGLARGLIDHALAVFSLRRNVSIVTPDCLSPWRPSRRRAC